MFISELPILTLVDVIASNDYVSEIDSKFLTHAKFLIENQYPVSTDDPTQLAEFLRQIDLDKRTKHKEVEANEQS